MFGLGMPEIIIIVVVLGIVFFGSNKLSEIAKSAGRFSGEFKKGKAEMEAELNKIKADFKGEDIKTVVKEEVKPEIKEEKKEESPIFSKNLLG